MTMNDFMMDMEARAFAAHAESNPRLKELAEKDSDKLLTEAEEDEFFALLNQAETSFFDEDPVDLFGPWWE